MAKSEEGVVAILAGLIESKIKRPPANAEEFSRMGLDSQSIIDLILTVEEVSGLNFDADKLDLEHGWEQMAQAFA